MKCFSYKGGYGIPGCTHIKAVALQEIMIVIAKNCEQLNTGYNNWLFIQPITMDVYKCVSWHVYKKLFLLLQCNHKTMC